MTTIFRSLIAAVLSFGSVLHAELPPALKPTAENYDRSMKSYDATVEAQVKAARDAYIATLDVARKRAAGAKRTEEVAAIEAETKAAKSGPLTGELPANLPNELMTFRERYVSAPKRATDAVASPRRFTRQNYLKWLDGMAAAAARGKDAALEAAVAAERKRVLASEEKAE